MAETVLFIHWDIDPDLFALGPLRVRWYGLLFAMAFLVGFQVIRRIFRAEGRPERDLDPLLGYMLVGAVVGARLGHCLFYDPAFYLGNPLEILKIWEGGLASHGGAIGIFISLFLYVRRRPHIRYLWLLDRVAIPTALGGCFIRLGNLFNSEIIGTPTDVPWAVVFVRVDALPRHPAQVYESIAYGLIFVMLLIVYRKLRAQAPDGMFLGLFLVSVFAFRFFVEFVKVRQAAYGAGLPLSVGQWLSIPMVLVGVILLVRAKKTRWISRS